MRCRLSGSECLSLHIQLCTNCDWSDSHPIRFMCGNQGQQRQWATRLVWTWLLCNIFTLCVTHYNVMSINVCMNTLNLLCLIKQTPVHATVSSSVSFNVVYGIYRTCTPLTVAHGHLPHFPLLSLWISIITPNLMNKNFLTCYSLDVS